MLQRIDPHRLDDPVVRAAWLEARKQGIGGSDAPAICGLSQYSSPLHVYLQKTGALEDKDSKVKRSGRLLEEVVAKLYEEQIGCSVWWPEYAISQHKDIPWMLASIDRFSFIGTKQRVVQIKTVGDRRQGGYGQPGTDDIPESVIVQVQHEMCVTDLEIADVPVFDRRTGDLFVYTVQRNDQLIEKLIRIERVFWNRVLDRQEPPPDYEHPETLDLLKRVYGVRDELAIALGEDAAALVRTYQDAAERETLARKAKEACKAELLHLMGEAGLARLPDGITLTRKTVERRGYHVEPTTYLDFRIRCPKEAKDE